MRGFGGLIRRNMLVYFKDRAAVVFSLLSSIIIFMLYVLFLKDNYVDSIADALGSLQGMVDPKDTDALVNMILLVGIIGCAMITVPYNCLMTIVSDREKNVDYDILATPLKRWQVIMGYFLAATFSAIIMSLILLVIGLGGLSLASDFHLTFGSVMFTVLIVIVGTISSSAFFMTIVMFFKSSAASGAFFGILSAASGFVIGAYMPLSTFSDGVRVFCNLFPLSQVTMLLRNSMMNNIIDAIENSIGGLDNGQFGITIKNIFTFNAEIGGHTFSISEMMLYIIGATVIFCILMVVLYNRNNKRK
ncbi:MAG: ABC transporter permease [Lachnospiraceae bacterium]|nr:ABC transporter permease [Lachnospiraceae bacterium]